MHLSWENKTCTQTCNHQSLQSQRGRRRRRSRYLFVSKHYYAFILQRENPSCHRYYQHYCLFYRCWLVFGGGQHTSSCNKKFVALRLDCVGCIVHTKRIASQAVIKRMVVFAEKCNPDCGEEVVEASLLSSPGAPSTNTVPLTVYR